MVVIACACMCACVISSDALIQCIAVKQVHGRLGYLLNNNLVRDDSNVTNDELITLVPSDPQPHYGSKGSPERAGTLGVCYKVR